MKLLIITQKVDINDGVLGFFHEWVKEFAKHCEKITVICLQKGECNLPDNIKVLSLGKEKGYSKLKYIFNFYKYIWRERKKYDSVFVHMNQEYVLLGGLFWKIMGKKILLWYVHKSVNWKLRLVEKLADKIFTASKNSFRLSSKKVEIVGHGIDVDNFKPKISNLKSDEKLKIITVGRIAEVKNLHLLIETAEILRNKNFNFGVKIAGTPILESDKIYFEKLKNSIQEKKLNDIIEFIGSVPNKDIAGFYQDGDLFINLSDTGSLDKAILEAMACGLKILTSNEAFKDIVPTENFTGKNAEEIAEKIICLAKNPNNPSLKDYVIKNHKLANLIGKIIEFYEKIVE